jgi:hypothetical protein
MNMNQRKKRLVYCPVEDDMVDVWSSCGNCELWDRRRCCFGHDVRSTVRALGRRGSLFGGRQPRLRFPRRRGKGLREPPVLEKWPLANRDGDEKPVLEHNPDYGVPEAQGPDLPSPGPENEDETVLPELVREYWDVEPDMPDWDMDAGTTDPADAVQMPEPLPPEPSPPPDGPELNPFMPDNPPGTPPGLPRPPGMP